jgi:signal transduction histidine kinase
MSENTAQPESISLEEKLAILEEKLMAAQRLATLGELSGTITHEFNNILMTIVNYSKLGMNNKDEKGRDKYFDKIYSASQKASKITSGILAMARSQGTETQATDVTKMIEDSLLLLEREMTKYRIQVERQFDVVPNAEIHAGQIQQVLTNLLINARQAMPDGGRLKVAIKHDSEHHFVDVIVRDYGMGIPQEKMRNIFDPFYTTKTGPDDSGKGGTGLGLAMCRNIIEKHGGKIRVESAEGKGTAFTLKLPVAKSNPAPLPASTNPNLSINVSRESA